jgi:hypothetical protein
MTPIRFVQASIAAVALTAVVAPAAQAAAVRVEGHVIAPPGAQGKRTAVPLLLTAKAERKLKLGKGVVRVLLPPRAQLSAPGPNGQGSVKLTPSALQAGDRVRAVAKLSRKQVKRLRKRSVPAFAVTKVSVVARLATLSTDDLKRMVAELDARLTALSQRVDGLAASNAAGMAALRGDLDAVVARTSALETRFDELGSSLGTLLTRFELLEGLVDPDLLAALRGDVDALLGRTGTLEGTTGLLTTSLGTLSGTVGGLGTSLTTVQGQIGPLQTSITGLSGRLDTADGVLADIPGLLNQLDDIESDLSGLAGRVDSSDLALQTVEDAVAGLDTTVGNLTTLANNTAGTVTQQGLNLGTLQGTVSTLGTNLGTVTGNLSTLQGTVTTLGGTVSGLSTTVGGLTTQVGSLTGVVCGLVIIPTPLCP